ncbi:hypothetical protein IRJ41_025970 [Triplophysa rosa]|uniref:Uncharacterized protein n=1 Tax=Triplophysa rosa TaxID=992332 RepID=A0A9W7TDF7_TRIRA|nr:hypothetical protein IRJ41_025970 [Triplophysa rosa]
MTHYHLGSAVCAVMQLDLSLMLFRSGSDWYSISRGCRRELHRHWSRKPNRWSSTSDEEEARTSPPTAVSQLPGFGVRLRTCFRSPFTEASDEGGGSRVRLRGLKLLPLLERIQHRQRVQYILEQSTDRTGQYPPASRVRRALERENAWTTNLASVESVLQAWVPCQEPSPVSDDPLVISSSFRSGKASP